MPATTSPLTRPAARRALLWFLTALLLVPGAAAPRAAAQPASPPATPSGDGSLFELTLPPGSAPDWSAVTLMSLTFVTVPPATTSEWDEANFGVCCPGPKLKYILAGTLSVVGEGPLMVLPSDAETFESIPAGTDVVLGPGDLVVTRNEHGDVWTNAAATPVELLSVPILTGDIPGPPLPPNWVIEEGDVRDGMALPSGSYILRLERRTLAPDATIPAPTAVVLQWGTLAPDQSGYIRRGSDEALTLRGTTTDVTMFLLTLTPSAPPTGTPTG